MPLSIASTRGYAGALASYGLRRPWLWLWAIVGLAVVLRAGVVVASWEAWYSTDSWHYLRLARDILEGAPTSERSNGYPLLIAALARLLPGGSIPLALVGLNVAASAAVVLLVGLIGRGVAGWGVGLLAALGTALYPNQLNYVRYILTEAPTTLLLVAAVWLLLRRRVATRDAFLAGVLLGLGVLLRSSLLGVGVSVLAVLVLFRRPWRESTGLVAGAALVGLFNVGLIAGGVIAPTQHTGPNMLISIQSTSSEGLVFSTEAFSPEERAAPLATYLRFAVDRPATFLHQRASALWELWGPWPAAGDPDAPRSALIRLLIGIRLALLLLAAGGLVRHHRRLEAWMLAAPLLAITAIHVAFFATPRFTYVVEPFAFVLAAWWVHDFVASRRARATPNALAPH